ncbi:MAG: DUF481 domain-containing protein [Deltaproteobacteria bacterium]|nr:DUF481 domain-containing protein [Deltaproteobacteria bacterium]
MKNIILKLPSALLLILLIKTNAIATVNIEAIRQSDRDEGLYNNISLSLTHSEGNTDISSRKLKLRSDHITKNNHAFISASFKRGEKDKKEYMDKGFAHIRGIMATSKPLAGEFFIQREYNDFTLLKDRKLIGTGARIRALNGVNQTSQLRLFLGLGVMWEEEVIDYTPDEEEKLYRATNYLSFRWEAKEKASLSATAYYQPSLKGPDDYRILFDGTIAFVITKQLSFTFDINYRYDSEPPIGVERDDLEITNGISLNF